MKYKTNKEIQDAIINLKADFDFFINNEILQTPEDFEVLSVAITKAFQCVPSCMEIPSQQGEAARNEAAAIAELKRFKESLNQEEINHPEKTVHGRAFIKNFDDQAVHRDSVRFKYLRCPFFIAG